MKEVKSFFVEDNTLNRGYSVESEAAHKWSPRKKVNDILPPPDVLAVYEDMYPGTLEKILSALDKEQQHQHRMNELSMKMRLKAEKIGRVFGVFSIVIISYAVVELAKAGMLVGGLIFALIAFACIYSISYVRNKRFADKPMHNNSDRRHHNKNYHRPVHDNKPQEAVIPASNPEKSDNNRRRRRK